VPTALRNSKKISPPPTQLAQRLTFFWQKFCPFVLPFLSAFLPSFVPLSKVPEDKGG